MSAPQKAVPLLQVNGAATSLAAKAEMLGGSVFLPGFTGYEAGSNDANNP